MPTARTELTLTESVVLALASEGPTHGWAIVKALRPDGALGAAWSTRGPLVYRAIRLLEQRGLVRSEGTEEGDGPARTILVATEEGARTAEAWLREPVAHVRDMRTELLVKLLLLERRGIDVGPLVREQRRRLEPQVAGLIERGASAPDDERLVALWRATNASAAIEFLDAVARRPAASGGADDPQEQREPIGGATPPRP